MNIFTKPYKVIYGQGEIVISAKEAEMLYRAFLGGHEQIRANGKYLSTKFRTMHPIERIS